MQEVESPVREEGQVEGGHVLLGGEGSNLTIDRAPAADQRRYGWLSRLRSYLFFDPLIWLYTVVFGIVSVPASLFGDKESTLHGFARGWSWLCLLYTSDAADE